MIKQETQTIQARLEKLALRKSTPFCYPCYRPAHSGRCETCQSDDLMRQYNGDVEWGIDWIIPILLEDHLAPVDVEKAFEESIRECYPETTRIGWIEYDTTSALKELDPVSWNLAQSEWLDAEASDERIISFDHGSTYYDVSELERFLDESETQGDAA